MIRFEDGKEYRVAFRTKPEVAFKITFDRSKFKMDRYGFLKGYLKADNGHKYYCALYSDEEHDKVEIIRICDPKTNMVHQRYTVAYGNGSTGWKEEALKG